MIWNPPLALAVFGVLGLALYALDTALIQVKAGSESAKAVVENTR